MVARRRRTIAANSSVRRWRKERFAQLYCIGSTPVLNGHLIGGRHHGRS
jgi:hypothetical protein